jgi:hypothetical protein
MSPEERAQVFRIEAIDRLVLGAPWLPRDEFFWEGETFRVRGSLTGLYVHFSSATIEIHEHLAGQRPGRNSLVTILYREPWFGEVFGDFWRLFWRYYGNFVAEYGWGWARTQVVLSKTEGTRYDKV